MTDTNATSKATNPVCSMTGYARVSGRLTDTLAFTLSLKSINHRFLDLQLRTPPGTEPLEPALRRELKARLTRGHVECILTLERSKTIRPPTPARAAPLFDLEALAAFLAHFRETARIHHLTSEPDLNAIARLPGMLLDPAASAPTAAAVLPETPDEQLLEREVLPRLREAIVQLIAMRAAEGATLVRALEANLVHLEAHTAEVAHLRTGARDAYYERLRERLRALVGEAASPQRLLEEAALLAERGDVEEELARLRAHIDHFRTLLAGGGEVGKKLDFLLQEMHREANTLLAKTTGTGAGGAQITAAGLAMKAEIEKAREQVQNLE